MSNDTITPARLLELAQWCDDREAFDPVGDWYPLIAAALRAAIAALVGEQGGEREDV